MNLCLCYMRPQFSQSWITGVSSIHQLLLQYFIASTLSILRASASALERSNLHQLTHCWQKVGFHRSPTIVNSCLSHVGCHSCIVILWPWICSIKKMCFLTLGYRHLSPCVPPLYCLVMVSLLFSSHALKFHPHGLYGALRYCPSQHSQKPFYSRQPWSILIVMADVSLYSIHGGFCSSSGVRLAVATSQRASILYDVRWATHCRSLPQN